MSNQNYYQLISYYYVWGVTIDKELDVNINLSLKQANITGIKRLLLEYFTAGGMWFNIYPFMFEDEDIGFGDILAGWLLSNIFYSVVFALVWLIFSLNIALFVVLSLHILCIIYGLTVTRRANFVANIENETDVTTDLIGFFEWMAGLLSNTQLQEPIIIDCTLTSAVNELVAKYGVDEVVRATENIAKKDSLELYWLARAGIQEVAPALMTRINYDDDCQRMWACMGLTYLNNDIGINALHTLIKKSSDNDSELTVQDIYQKLSTSDLLVLDELKNQIRLIY